MKRFLASLLLVGVVGGFGCQSRVTEIDGRKVVGTRWVNGKIVYILERDKDDELAMASAANEARRASEGVKFKPRP